MFNKRLKNLLLTTALATSLSACGGGGGGGSVPISFNPQPVSTIAFSSGISSKLVQDFVQTVHTLSQDEVLDVKDTLKIFTWVNENQANFDSGALNGYKITVDGTEMSLEKGFNMLLGFKKRYYDGKEKFWENTAETGKFDDEDEDYLALKTTAEEDLTKTKDELYNDLESTGTATVVSTTEKNSFSTPVYSIEALSPVVTYSDWSMVSSENGDSTSTSSTVEENRSGAVYQITTTTTVTPLIKTYNRTKTTTTSYKKTKTVIKTSTIYTLLSNGERTIDVTKTTVNSTVPHDPDVVKETEQRQETIEGTPVVETAEVLIENPLVSSEAMDPLITETVTEGNEYTETTSVLGETQSSYTEEGSATTSTSYKYEDTVVDNGDNTATTTRTKFLVTTTTLPVTTYYTKVRTYTDKVYKDVTTTITTTPRTLKTYANGDTEVVNGASQESQSIVKTLVSTSERSETEIVDSEVDNQINTAAGDGVVEWIKTTSTAYTDLDNNLGIRTDGYNTDKTSYETNEYLDIDANGNLQGWANGGKKQVNASTAYSRGWTGKGVIVAVADTGYDVDHSEFEGQVIATKDYTGTGINDNHGHGTHVLGSIVAKKDDAGTHGVAFDSKAVVIKIGDSRYVNTSDAATGFSWAADQGASVGNVSANSSYDFLFRQNLVELEDGTFKSTDDRYNYSAGQFYNAQSPLEWKQATDKDMVIVNSAGNQGLDVSANPGYFATAVDGDGNLILGGKMLIVGAVDQNNFKASWSNKAGHICQVVVDNKCTDKYKVSDFYIMAPGWTYSTSNDGGYDTMAGTSMAAPYVSGGVALVRQMWPYMKGENVVKLLTTTANKDILDYNVNIHGAGVMDMDKATQPVGATGIPTTGRTTSSVSTVSLSNSGGSGSSIGALTNSSALSNVMIVDEFARDFYVDLTKGITVKDTRKYSDVEMQLNKNSYLPYIQSYGSFNQGIQTPVFKDGLEFGIYSGENGNGDWSTNISQKFRLSDSFSIKTTGGFMNEQNTWLGNATDGALAVGKNNETTFGQLGLEYKMDNNIISLDVAQGYTDVSTVSNSMISNVDTLETQSLKLGYEKQVDQQTTWGITYSLPNRITNGDATLNVPYATTADGQILYDSVKTDLSQKTQEKNIGFYYSYNGEEDTDWKTSFSIEYRQNVAGVGGDDKIAPSMSVSKKFWGACVSIFGMKNMQPGCVKMRLEKKLAKLLKKKNKEEEIQEVRLQLMENEKKIAKIMGKELPTNTEQETAIAWNQ